jgi:hypothetical protein
MTTYEIRPNIIDTPQFMRDDPLCFVSIAGKKQQLLKDILILL